MKYESKKILEQIDSAIIAGGTEVTSACALTAIAMMMYNDRDYSGE